MSQVRTAIKFLIYAAGPAFIFFLSLYLCESVIDSLIVTAIFGGVLTVCVHVLMRKFTEYDSSSGAAFNFKQAGGEIFRDLTANFLVIAAIAAAGFFGWKAAYPLRARVLKDIGIMLQPKDLSEEYLSSAEGRKKMGKLCYFGTAAYKLDPRVLVEWEIKAIRGMCMASEDDALIEEMQRVLPDIEEEIEFEDDSLHIAGNAADSDEAPQEDAPIQVSF